MYYNIIYFNCSDQFVFLLQLKKNPQNINKFNVHTFIQS